MNEADFFRILEKFNRGEATREEIEFLLAYYDLFEAGENELDRQDALSKARINHEIRLRLKEHQLAENDAVSHEYQGKRNAFLRWASVAAVLIGLAWWAVRFANHNNRSALAAKTRQENALPDSITPGKNDATLTLANGEVISLNSHARGEIAEEAGVTVKKADDGRLTYEVRDKGKPVLNTVTTPKGGQYQLVLSDGSTVWLNAASSITFPTAFDQENRTVRITGEAYFEVSGDKSRPFRVLSENQLVEVVGTHFNVNTYADESASKTTLLEGSVRIFRLGTRGVTGTGKMLRPGQQAILPPGQGEIALRNVNVEEAVAWKNGYFKFEKADIKTVMRQICRWYNVEVEYRGSLTTDIFAGEIDRSEDVNQVLRILMLSNVNVRIEGRKIIIINDTT